MKKSEKKAVKPVSRDLLPKMEAGWRAANYLSVGPTYRHDDPPLKKEHVKLRLVGRWGTPPGRNSKRPSQLNRTKSVANVCLGAWRWCLIVLLPILVVTGCATSGSGSRPPKRGEGLREYLQLVFGLQKAVTASRQSLETLSTATQGNAAATYARFDSSLQRLEVVSIKARARAEAMEKRGEAYFEEWTEEISGSADETSRRYAKARFAELHQHFEAILYDSRQVRQEFRPFLEGVRRLRTRLGPKPEFEAIEKARPDFAQLVVAGRSAEGKMDQLLKTLKAAETAVMAGPMPPIKPGGKL